jgi:hypothetical protein
VFDACHKPKQVHQRAVGQNEGHTGVSVSVSVSVPFSVPVCVCMCALRFIMLSSSLFSSRRIACLVS